MAEKKKRVIPNGGVLLEIDGQERMLRYPLNSLLLIEERLGVNMLTDGAKVFTREHLADVKTFRFLLWAGFVHADESLKEDQIGLWFDPNNLEALSEAVMEAMGVAYDDPKGDPSGTDATGPGAIKKN